MSNWLSAGATIGSQDSYGRRGRRVRKAKETAHKSKNRYVY
jgi:hypothetical protein